MSFEEPAEFTAKAPPVTALTPYEQPASGVDENDYHALFENAHDAIFVVEPEHEVVLACNQRACEIYGYERHELVGMSLRSVSHDVTRGRLKVVETLASRVRTRFETVQYRKDGSELHLEVHASPTTYRGVRAILSINRDVTERRRGEEALRRREDELRQAQKLEAVGRLAADIAHDFNNLLAVIVGESELLLRRFPEGDGRRLHAAAIADAGARASRLTRDLVAFSRKQALRPRVVALGEIVVALDPILRRLVGDAIEFVVVTDARPLYVLADPRQFDQILLNLAANARDAMPSGGVLTVAVDECGPPPDAAPGRYARLSVTDTGSGIDEATQERVFEPFFTTKSADRGSGLGLPSVRATAAQLGGSVRLVSAPGRGTRVEVDMPLADGDDTREEAAAKEGGATVLVVDPRPDSRAFTAGALTAAGYHVLEAPDAERALAVAAEGGARIDLVITDIVTPGSTGRDLATRIAAQFPRVRVLFVTEYPPESVAQYVVLDEDAALLQRPFPVDTLVRRVRGLLAEA